jgi:hypothetical protein
MAAGFGAAGAMGDRTRPPSLRQDARITAFSPWKFAAPPISQAVRASRTALSGRFDSTAVEDVA